MAIERDNLQKPVSTLRKAMERLGKDPTEEEVHKLRTESRRLESMVSALRPGSKKDARRLLKSVRPVRRAAGKVRDMDVLSAKVLGLGSGVGDAGRVRLLEHLGGMRMKSARVLFDVVSARRPAALRRLKQQSRLIDREFGGSGDATGAAERVAAAALELAEDLARWPMLTPETLHDFRKKVKALRYVLELVEERDAKLVKELGEVKDRIGEWHDWLVLTEIAGEVLDRKENRGLLREIATKEGETYRLAVGAEKRLRERCFGPGKKGARGVRADSMGKLAGRVVG